MPAESATPVRQPSRTRKGTTPGAMIANRYRVDRLIARGGMAAVYLATHVQLNRKVALKLMQPPADAEDPSAFEQRFRLEAETVASLHHPNIVVVHDYGETDDGRYFLSMEYVDGPRFTDLIQEQPLAPDRCLRLVLQVCAALHYAHKKGVVHRDLKPSNLLVRVEDDDELLKVVDFGLVKLTESDQSITRAGLILGSPHFMSPEQIRGDSIDHRTDIYATGVLLFRALTGTYPFHGSNSAATMISHLNDPIPTFFSVAPELEAPVGLEEVVHKCLAKDADERFRTMKELIEALAPLANMSADGFRSVAVSSISYGSGLSTSTGSLAKPRENVPGLASAEMSVATAVPPADGRKWALAGVLATLFLFGAAGAGALGMFALTQSVGTAEPPPIIIPARPIPTQTPTVVAPPVVPATEDGEATQAAENAEGTEATQGTESADTTEEPSAEPDPPPERVRKPPTQTSRPTPPPPPSGTTEETPEEERPDGYMGFDDF